MIELDISERVATLILNRPPVNGMNDAWVMRFGERLDELDSRIDWNVVLIRSALNTFCAGADLKQFNERFDQPIEEQLEVGRRYQRLFARIENLPCVTIAEIGGSALGGGLELALACDFRIASYQAKLGLPEVGLGLLPGAGGTQRLTWLCGLSVASRLILGSEVITGEEAKLIGLVHWAFDRGVIETEARSRAKRFASNPRHAIAAAKAAMLAAGQPHINGFDTETEGLRTLLQSPETRELVSAFFRKSTEISQHS